MPKADLLRAGDIVTEKLEQWKSKVTPETV